MTNQNIQVQLINFPTKGNEAITKNEDDSYTIFINARLSHEKQLEAYWHAMKHIQNGDFEKTDADKIEFDAHQMKIALELCI